MLCANTKTFISQDFQEVGEVPGLLSTSCLLGWQGSGVNRIPCSTSKQGNRGWQQNPQHLLCLEHPLGFPLASCHSFFPTPCSQVAPETDLMPFLGIRLIKAASHNQKGKASERACSDPAPVGDPFPKATSGATAGLLSPDGLRRSGSI